MAAQTKTSEIARVAGRIAATIPALVLLSASARASATLIAAKCSAITTVAETVLGTTAAVEAVTRLLPVANRGLELCVLGDVVRALGFLQISESIWQVLQVVGCVAGEWFVTHLIWSALSLLY